MRFNYGFNYDVYMEIIWKYSCLCLCHQVQQVDCIWHTVTNKDPNITRVFMFYRSKNTWNLICTTLSYSGKLFAQFIFHLFAFVIKQKYKCLIRLPK